MLIGWAEDGHANIVHLYLSCVGVKNIAQSLLRDVGRCCKEAPLPSKAQWTHGMCCSAARQSLSVHSLIFSKFKYHHVKVASLATVKSYVTVGPIC